jgi:5-methylcytosine-specific restriction endonuclease McrA
MRFWGKRMIKINRRTECPDCLKKPPGEFSEADLKDVELREVLLDMQNNKCCYCEKDISASGRTGKNVEHYIPSSDDSFKDAAGKTIWGLANNWLNLMYSCSECNNRKLGQPPIDPETKVTLLINPTDNSVDPEDELDFVLVDMCYHHNPDGKTQLGKTTCEILKFAVRTDLMISFIREARNIKKIITDLGIAILAKNKTTIEEKLNDIKKATSAHQNFAAFRRALIVKEINVLNDKILPKYEERTNEKLARINPTILDGAKVYFN